MITGFKTRTNGIAIYCHLLSSRRSKYDSSRSILYLLSLSYLWDTLLEMLSRQLDIQVPVSGGEAGLQIKCGNHSINTWYLKVIIKEKIYLKILYK